VPRIVQHELRIVLDPSGRPVAGSATTLMDDETYRTAPVEAGPFDTVGEFAEELSGRLDRQLSLW
jgi:hypothetical protein